MTTSIGRLSAFIAEGLDPNADHHPRLDNEIAELIAAASNVLVIEAPSREVDAPAPDPLVTEGRSAADALALRKGEFATADLLNRLLDRIEKQSEQLRQAHRTTVAMIGVATDRADERDAALADLAEANAAIDRVLAGTYRSSDGTEWTHLHPDDEGEPNCPKCWATMIRQAVRRDT